MITYHNKLTLDIKTTYGNRKKRGIISLLYDAKKDAFIPIPTNKEHIEIVMEILNKTKVQIIKNPDLASHLIPINIFIEEDKIKEVLIGISGIEMGYKVRHSKTDLTKAHEASWNFINNGEIEILPNLKRVLRTDYIK